MLKTKKVAESPEEVMARLSIPSQKKLSEISEEKVKADIRKYLKKLRDEGYQIKHFHYSSKNGEPGVSDRVCCICGRFVSIEAKRPRFEKKIPEMRRNIAEIMKLEDTQIGITATSGDGLSDFGCGEGIQCFCIITTDG